MEMFWKVKMVASIYYQFFFKTMELAQYNLYLSLREKGSFAYIYLVGGEGGQVCFSVEKTNA